MLKDTFSVSFISSAVEEFGISFSTQGWDASSAGFLTHIWVSILSDETGKISQFSGDPPTSSQKK